MRYDLLQHLAAAAQEPDCSFCLSPLHHLQPPHNHLPASLPTTLRRRRRDIRHQQAVRGLAGEVEGRRGVCEGGGGSRMSRRSGGGGVAVVCSDSVWSPGRERGWNYSTVTGFFPPLHLPARTSVYNPWCSPGSYISRYRDKGYISRLQDHWPLTENHKPALLSPHHQPL